MDDTAERRLKRERLVAYFIGGLVREYGINVSNQPGPVARLRHFAEVGQTALEEDRLEALSVNDRDIATGLDGSPLPFQVTIAKNMLREILDGKIPPPVDDEESVAARAARLKLKRRDKQVAEAVSRLKKSRDEEKERDAQAVARWKQITLVSAIAVIVAIAAVVFFASHSSHHEHEKKSEGAH